MTKGSIDRRVVRTREMLHQALMSLILEKGYEAISIKDICGAANVGRSTFYAHYTCKDDLKRSGLESMRKLLIDRQRNSSAREGMTGQSLGFSLAMFEHARDHLGLYRALVGSRIGTIALGTIREILSDLVRDELVITASKASKEAVPREVVVQHIVGAYMAVLTWWLDKGAKIPPERIDTMFRRLATEGLAPSCS